jgi:DNA-binding transcriptional ArsR family regulator
MLLLGSALHADVRCRMLRALLEGPRSVESLGAAAGITSALASHHVKLLLAGRIVTTDAVGREKLVAIAPTWEGPLAGLVHRLEELTSGDDTPAEGEGDYEVE